VRLALLNAPIPCRFPRHIPQTTLISWELSLIPHVDQDALRPVLVLLILELLYLHLHSILGESDMLAFHLLSCVLAHVLHNCVHDVADDGDDGDEEEEQDEGEDVAALAFGLGHGG